MGDEYLDSASWDEEGGTLDKSPVHRRAALHSFSIAFFCPKTLGKKGAGPEHKQGTAGYSSDSVPENKIKKNTEDDTG